MKKFLSILAGLSCFILAGGAVAQGFAGDKQAVVALAEEQQIVYLGDKISVEEKTLRYGDAEKPAVGQIITPQGASYVSDSFVADEGGVWQVVYKAYFTENGKTVEVTETETYLCKKTNADMFVYNDAVTASYGEYKWSTAKKSHSGAIFKVRQGAEITFDVPLNPNNFDRKTPLIDFIVEPETLGQGDFEELRIRVTDMADEGNYVDVILVDGGFINANGTATFARASFQGGVEGGWEDWQNKYVTTGTGTGLSHSFHGYPLNEPTQNLRIFFDYATKSIWGNPGALTFDATWFVNQFNDTPMFHRTDDNGTDLYYETLYKFNPWGGFTSDKVKISIIPSGFKNPTGTLLVKSIGGIDLSQEVMEDTVAPKVTVDYQGQNVNALPSAKVGMDYALFPAMVVDNYDVDLTAKVSVAYVDKVNGQYIDVSVKDGKFHVAKEGEYIITYTAKDYSGNAASKVKVKVKTADVQEVELTLEETEGVTKMYDSVTLPSVEDLTVNGGTGVIALNRTVYDPNGNLITMTGDKLLPTVFGEYKVCFTASDYLGNQGEAVYTLNVEDETEPKFIEEVYMPPVLMEGFTYEVFSPKAIKTENGVETILKTQVTANGAAVTGNTFKAEGNSMEIVYFTDGMSEENQVKFVIPVVSGSKMISLTRPGTDQVIERKSLVLENYFYVNQGDVTVENCKDDLYLSTTSNNTEVIFANRLSAHEFSLVAKAEAGRTNFSSFVVKLVDATNSNISLTLKVDMKNKKIYYPNGVSAFSIMNDEWNLQYRNSSFELLDNKGNVVGLCTTDDNGNTFNGFAQGVYMYLSFEGVAGKAGLHLKKINNQALGHAKENLTETTVITEETNPVIVYDATIRTEQLMGETLVYPTFTAYDVFSEIKTATITVKAPDGTILKTLANDVYEAVKIEQFGKYKVIYYAEDGSGNYVEFSKTIFVNDTVAPTISVNALTKTEYAVGDVVELPNYYGVSDNLGDYTVDVSVILPNNEMRLLVHDVNGQKTYYTNNRTLYNASFCVSDTSFRAEYKGTYTLRYVAYDAHFNKSVIELTFTVK